MCRPVQLRHETPLTSEAYLAERAWEKATLPRCPRHPAGGCGFARHGTYPRLRKVGALRGHAHDRVSCGGRSRIPVIARTHTRVLPTRSVCYRCQCAADGSLPAQRLERSGGPGHLGGFRLEEVQVPSWSPAGSVRHAETMPLSPPRRTADERDSVVPRCRESRRATSARGA